MMQNKFKIMKSHMTNIKVSVSVGEILQKEEQLFKKNDLQICL